MLTEPNRPGWFWIKWKDGTDAVYMRSTNGMFAMPHGSATWAFIDNHAEAIEEVAEPSWRRS